MRTLIGDHSTSVAKRRTRPTTVSVRMEDLVFPTYLPAPPDKNPMFLENRVYQGSSGKVYPLPFTDRISEKPIDRKWKAVWIENEFIRAMVLPELGGRIHVLQDKTNGYDLIYNQKVIKPALVGLTGPWASGGIEFNWPQHHRPATFLPVDVEVEEHADGSKTVWCGDHDPMCRMKGMHGLCLHPGKAYLELKVRAYNRTPFVQSFLWWANLAARVHEAYQSFFPPDVHFVADHARRSISEYPLAKGIYYGVNYGERGRRGVPLEERPRQFHPLHRSAAGKNGHSNGELPTYAANDISFYANIPTPCSYMCVGSKEDFVGGYDFIAQAGLIHIANHHISPGKKQWTWGNQEFGYAWDRNLTEPDERGEYAPYIEIMAGVYTDNQPDFSFLQPGETRTWSQYWYPIQKIGPARHANLRAAVSLKTEGGQARLGVAVTEIFKSARIVLSASGTTLFNQTHDLAPDKPLVAKVKLPPGIAEDSLQLRVLEREGGELIACDTKATPVGPAPVPAKEPSAPENVASADELYLIGLHLDQYRHATRCPTLYWREALRRDSGDSRCNNGMGLWRLKRGEWPQAEAHFRKSIERLTSRNANPADGEPYYNLGLCLRFQIDAGATDDGGAYAAFYKSTWNQAWAGAAFLALAEFDCRKSDWKTALEHLNRSLRLDSDSLRARALKAIVLGRLGQEEQAGEILHGSLALDPLDWWARHLLGQPASCDAQTALDLAHDFARSGFYAEAVSLLTQTSYSHGNLPDQSWGAAPLVQYTLGWLREQMDDTAAALAHYRQAASLPTDYCFPARLEEIFILESAMRANPQDARAPYYLGNLFYDRRRHEEAVRLWERAAKLDPKFSIVWRNLGIARFNIARRPAAARAAYERAFSLNPTDGRLLLERDQLWKRLGEKPQTRLGALEKHLDLVRQRDDLSIELCALYNQVGRHQEARALVCERGFQPWEGGEGGPLGQHVRSHLALGREAMAAGKAALAREHFQAALNPSPNLGEARHTLANCSDIHFWLGVASDALGDRKSARQHWLAASSFKGDFQEMSVRALSEMTYYSARALERLAQGARAKRLFRELLAYGLELQKSTAKIDYFATSLPAMLLFNDDLQYRQETSALFIQAQAWLGLGKKAKARTLLQTVLRRDPNHAPAADLSAEL